MGIKSVKVFAPAKINLHLEVLGLRCDGFHELAMVMQSINLFDQIEIIAQDKGVLSLSSSEAGLSCGEENLIIKAAKLLRQLVGLDDLGAEIKLIKNIPIGAGLAGGSTDAAATLVGLNSAWDLGLSKSQLIALGAQLGSDVPFCFDGGTQLTFGRGESLEPLRSMVNTMAILLVKDPLVSVSTPWAYSLSKKVNGSRYLKEESEYELRRAQLRKASWLNPLTSSNPPPLINDLQKVVAPVTPAVLNALDFLASLPGAISFAMSGSGPSCFALYPDLPSANSALKSNSERIKAAGLNAWCCEFVDKGAHFQNSENNSF